jgi:hypothetical protein
MGERGGEGEELWTPPWEGRDLWRGISASHSLAHSYSFDQRRERERVQLNTNFWKIKKSLK